MKTSKYDRYFILTLHVWIIYGIFFNLSLYAQDINNQLLTISTDLEIYAKNESIVALTLKIKNDVSLSFDGYLSLKEVNGISMVGRDRLPVTLEGNSFFFYPLRLSISEKVLAGTTPIILQLYDKTNHLKASFQSHVIVQSLSDVRLLSLRSTQLMKQVGDSLEISAMVRNEGNNTEDINVTASFPNMKGGNIIESQQVRVLPFQDTVVTFRKIITKELLQVDHYIVNIAALYADGGLINNIMVTVENASGSRTYRDPLYQGFSYNSFSPNSIGISNRNMFTDNEALQINGKGTFQLGEGSLAFNLDSYIYTKNNVDPLLTNTYVNYERNNTGILLGSLNENLETYINGRGMKVYHRNEDETQLVEIGIADKNYNLLGNRNRIGGDEGYTAFTKVYFYNPNNKKKYTGSIIYDRSDLENTENIIAMNEYSFPLNEKLIAGIEAGAGLTRLSAPASEFKPALALGVSLNGLAGEYSLASNNFYSTAYYPGIRRGLMNFNERVSRRFNKVNVWVGYNYYNYDPAYLKSYFFYNSKSTSSSVEAGTYLPISSNFSFSLAAKKQVDQGNVYSSISMISTMQQLNSWRFSETFSWRSKNDQHLVRFTSENGFGRLTNSDENQLQIRTSLSWNYGPFTLNGYYQEGNFTVREAYSSYGENRSIRRFNLSPSIQKDFFDNRLVTMMNVNFNRDSYVGNNWSFSTNISYAFSNRFSGFVNAFVYDYKNFLFNSSFANVQTGITYKLPSAQQGKTTKKGNIFLFLFYDYNTNNIFDEGDVPASERIVRIGGITFVSLSNGTIIYNKVPYASYDIDIPSSDWHASTSDQIHLNEKDFRLNIPLQETGKITGSFIYNYDERISEEVNDQISGLRVWLIGKNGSKIPSVSNANGQFTLFAPVGEYSFQVDEESLPTNVYTEFKSQTVKIEKGKTTTAQTIELQVKQKKVEVKRFSS